MQEEDEEEEEEDMERNLGPCAYGGDHPAEKVSSGTPICWDHWYWRRLDLPAALHWAKVSAEFLSNVDGYDFKSYFGAAGITEDEAITMIVSAEKLLAYSKLVKEGLPPKIQGPICAACGEDGGCLSPIAHHKTVTL